MVATYDGDVPNSVVGAAPERAAEQSAVTDEQRREASALAVAASLGGTLVACVVGGLLAGLWADAALGTSPWLLLLGLFVGLGAAVVAVRAVAQRLSGDPR